MIDYIIGVVTRVAEHWDNAKIVLSFSKTSRSNVFKDQVTT